MTASRVTTLRRKRRHRSRATLQRNRLSPTQGDNALGAYFEAQLIRPTKTEEAAINAGIAADPDTYELSDAEFRQLRPARGRPKSLAPQERITIRLSSDMPNSSNGAAEVERE